LHYRPASRQASGRCGRPASAAAGVSSSEAIVRLLAFEESDVSLAAGAGHRLVRSSRHGSIARSQDPGFVVLAGNRVGGPGQFCCQSALSARLHAVGGRSRRASDEDVAELLHMSPKRVQQIIIQRDREEAEKMRRQLSHAES
jgi:hypothetical protein